MLSEARYAVMRMLPIRLATTVVPQMQQQQQQQPVMQMLQQQQMAQANPLQHQMAPVQVHQPQHDLVNIHTQVLPEAFQPQGAVFHFAQLQQQAMLRLVRERPLTVVVRPTPTVFDDQVRSKPVRRPVIINTQELAMVSSGGRGRSSGVRGFSTWSRGPSGNGPEDPGKWKQTMAKVLGAVGLAGLLGLAAHTLSQSDDEQAPDSMSKEVATAYSAHVTRMVGLVSKGTGSDEIAAALAQTDPSRVEAKAAEAFKDVSAVIRSSNDIAMIKDFLHVAIGGHSKAVQAQLATIKATNPKLELLLQEALVNKATMGTLQLASAYNDLATVLNSDRTTPATKGLALAKLTFAALAVDTASPKIRFAASMAVNIATTKLDPALLKIERPLTLLLSPQLLALDATLGKLSKADLHATLYESLFASPQLMGDTQKMVKSWTSTYSASSYQADLRKDWVNFINTGDKSTALSQFLNDLVTTRKDRWTRLSERTGIPVPESFHVFRGVRGEFAVEGVVNAWRNGKDVTAAARSLASWSMDRNVAKQFASGGADSVVYETHLPFDQTLADKWADDGDFISVFSGEREVISAMPQDNAIPCPKQDVTVRYRGQEYTYAQKDDLIAAWDKDHGNP